MEGAGTRLPGNGTRHSDVTLAMPQVERIERRRQQNAHQQHETQHREGASHGIVVGPVNHVHRLVGEGTEVGQPSKDQSSASDDGPEQGPDNFSTG